MDEVSKRGKRKQRRVSREIGSEMHKGKKLCLEETKSGTHNELKNEKTKTVWEIEYKKRKLGVLHLPGGNNKS